MSKRNISGRNLDKAITSDDILGKKVIDAEGNYVGISERILFDEAKMEFIGLGVDKGILSKGVLIGKNYINKITRHAIFLKIRILYEVKGMTVFDRCGRKVGVVSAVKLEGNKNNLKYLEVNLGAFRKNIIVNKELIENISDSVLLNIEKSNLIKLLAKEK